MYQAGIDADEVENLLEEVSSANALGVDDGMKNNVGTGAIADPQA